MTETKSEKKDNTIEKPEEAVNFKGRYIYAVGKRKTAVAKIRLYDKGTGIIMINGEKANRFFPTLTEKNIISQPLKLTGHLKDLNFSIMVSGGGKNGQAEAICHGITRSLVKFEKESKPVLKAKDLLTRDSRKKERKKPGLKKARRAPQWAKR